jgi:hypothetical protein
MEMNLYLNAPSPFRRFKHDELEVAFTWSDILSPVIK